MNKYEPNQLNLFLGDVILIKSPTNKLYDNNSYFIEYLDQTKIKIVGTEGSNFLYLGKNGEITDYSIETIQVIHRQKTPSYIEQNGLYTSTWVDIKFGGDIPMIVTGEITNTIEDMIEITTVPNKEVLFIDFAYQGVPENLPIEYIQIRDAPASLKEKSSQEPDMNKAEELIPDNMNPQEIIKSSETEESPESSESSESLETQQSSETEETPKIESSISDPDEIEVENDVENVIDDTDDVEDYFEQEEEILGMVTQFVNVVESKKRYTIDEQKEHMLESMLSRIPEQKKSKALLQQIIHTIKRFEELRNHHTIFDENGHPRRMNIKGKNYNALKESFLKSDDRYSVYYPIVSVNKINYEASVDMNHEHDFELYNSYTNKQLTYYDYMNEVSESLTPFERIDSTTLYKMKTEMDIDTIIDNNGSYSMKLVGTDDAKFVTQRMLSKIEFNSLSVMPNEYMDIKGFITRPWYTNQHLRANLFQSNILDKINTANIPTIWNIDRISRTNLVSKEKDQFKNSSQYNNVLTHMMEHILDDDLTMNKAIFFKFMDALFPSRDDIIPFIINYKKCLSIRTYMNSIEPYNMYMHNMHYFHYKKLLDGVYNNVREFWNIYKAQRKTINSIARQMSNLTKFQSTLLSTLELDNITNEYQLTNSKLTDSELLARIQTTDNSDVCMEFLKVETHHLINDVNIDFQRLMTEISQDTKKANATQECKTYKISKKYKSIDELQKDNDKPTYYDKNYDDTVYDVIAVYEQEKSSMKSEEFLEFLRDKLVEVNGIEKEKAKQVAEDMIIGKKLVRNGEYAIVQEVKEEEEEVKLEYYRRTDNKWVFDKEATDNQMNYALPMKQDMCEDVKCIGDLSKSKTLESNYKDKNIRAQDYESNMADIPVVKNYTCEPSSVRKSEVKEKLLKDMMEEYKHKIVQKETYYKSKLEKYTKDLNVLNALKISEQHQYERFALLLGSRAPDIVSIQSPNMSRLQDIFTISDIPTKQKEILMFVHKYCRSPIYPEDKYWYYCKETNTKLLPTFYHAIAKSLVQSKQNFDNGEYIRTIELLHRNQGAISDDGGFIVDKHSGQVIAPIDYHTDEGFDEQGHKVNSRSVIDGTTIPEESDEVDVMIDKLVDAELSMKATDIDDMGSSDDAYKTNTKEFVQSIIRYICMELNIDLGVHMEYITHKTIIIFDKYRNKKNEEYTLVLLTIAMLFVGIQLHFPRLTGKYMRINDCKASFEGYPLGDENDDSGLKFFACLISKRKKRISRKLKQADANKIQEQLSSIIKTFILDHIQDDIINIREEEAKRNEILSIFSKKSLTFLPPLNTFVISRSNLQNDLKASITTIKNAKHVLPLIEGIRSRNIYLSYGMIELMNKCLKKENLMLQNHNTNEYYLENSCCAESTIQNIFQYLSKSETDINRYKEIITNNQEYMSQISNIPQRYISKNKTKVRVFGEANKYSAKTVDLFFRKIVHDENQETTYRAMIDYLNNKYISSSKSSIDEYTPVGASEYISSIFIKSNSMTENDLNVKLLNLIDKCNENDEMKDVIMHKLEVNDFLLTKINDFNTKIKSFTNERITILDLCDQLESDNKCITMKNKIMKYCHNLPLAILNNLNTNSKLPKHWNISSSHQKDLLRLIENEQQKFDTYKGKTGIDEISKKMIYLLHPFLPIVSKLNYLRLNEKDMCIDSDMHYQILKYIFAFVLSSTIEETTDAKHMKIVRDLFKSYKGDIKDYLSNFNFDMDVLRRRVLKAKEREKDRITRDLKKKSDQEREVSNILKENKLGEWNIGEQKGLRVYDKNFRDLNRPEGEDFYQQNDAEHEYNVMDNDE